LHQFSAADIADQEFFELATKLTILSVLSVLSSALMCVCVVIVGLLSRDMTDILMLCCLAMFLAIKIGAAPYRCLCAPMHSCCHRMFAPKKMKDSAKEKTAAPTKVELAIAASIAADDAETTAQPKLSTPNRPNRGLRERVNASPRKSETPGENTMVIHPAPVCEERI